MANSRKNEQYHYILLSLQTVKKKAQCLLLPNKVTAGFIRDPRDHDHD